MAGSVHVVDHPLVQHKLTLLRKKETSTREFRQLLEETAILLGYEVTRDLKLEVERIETPLEPMDAPVLHGKKVVVISVLRAGDGLLAGILRLIPSARVGHIGLFRDPKTLEPTEYYFKVPGALQDRDVVVVDPMLATGNSAVAAVQKVALLAPKSLRFLCLVAAPEGLETFHRALPDVPVYTAAVDRGLDERGYIVPGLGDAGDRLFGTK